mgnify:CR=1 FL=1
MNFNLLLHTICHLKPIQLVYQVRNRVLKPKFQMHHYLDDWQIPSLKTDPIPRPKCRKGNIFTFINIASEFTDWNDASRGMLWAYNQNYFDYINDVDSDKAYGEYWIDKFIREIPNNKVGLDPYPIALRGINWVKFFSRYLETLTKERADSLFSQYKLLKKKLEYHLLGNHLLEDFYSLYIMSIFFNDIKYHRWVTKKLLKELKEEILVDGGHYEQSVMYHCILLDRLLDCINFSKDVESNQLNIYASKMLGWLQSMCYDDNTYPLFNDSAYGIAPTPEEIFNYAGRLGLTWSKNELRDSGYRKLKTTTSKGTTIEVFTHTGNITASYQPGHSHADTFTYELKINGKPFVVDTGISTYNKTARREYERSTYAHNTVCFIGKDKNGKVCLKNSSETWGGFRVGKRAVVRGDSCTTADNKVHARQFFIDKEGFEVLDQVEYPAVSLIHLAPDVKVCSITSSENNSYLVETNMMSITISGATDVKECDCLISREYNKLLESKSIEISFSKEIKYRIHENIIGN